MSEICIRAAAVSYEGSLFGWDVEPTTEGAGLQTRLSFGFHCSMGSLKVVAVSASGKFLCCGGMDERIHVFDLEQKRAVGEVTGHTGAVTCLTFIGDTNLLSGSEDSTICIWRVYDWQCLHILGGHKSGVTGVAVHPSGKMALSVAKDNTLKTWNLVHGRCAFTRRLRGSANKVLWHSDGEHYLLVIDSELQVYKASDNNTCAAKFSFGSRINQAIFCSPGPIKSNEEELGSTCCIAAVCDNKIIHVVNVSGKKLTSDGVDLTPILDSGRPRDMWSCKPAAVGSVEMREILREEGDCLSIVTSNGLLVVISCRAICQLSDANDDNSEVEISHAVLTSDQIKAQPRLTAIVSWVQSASAPSKKRDQPDSDKEKDDVDDGKKKVKFVDEGRREKKKDNKKSS